MCEGVARPTKAAVVSLGLMTEEGVEQDEALEVQVDRTTPEKGFIGTGSHAEAPVTRWTLMALLPFRAV